MSRELAKISQKWKKVSCGGPRSTTLSGLKDVGEFKNEIHYDFRSVITVIEPKQ